MQTFLNDLFYERFWLLKLITSLTHWLCLVGPTPGRDGSRILRGVGVVLDESSIRFCLQKKMREIETILVPRVCSPKACKCLAQFVMIMLFFGNKSRNRLALPVWEIVDPSLVSVNIKYYTSDECLDGSGFMSNKEEYESLAQRKCGIHSQDKYSFQEVISWRPSSLVNSSETTEARVGRERKS